MTRATALRLSFVALFTIACAPALHAGSVRYSGTATIVTDTSDAGTFPLAAMGLGFADGTNLLGLQMSFSLTFDESLFGPGAGSINNVGYVYIGTDSVFKYQVAGGTEIVQSLQDILISNYDAPVQDRWLANSSPDGLIMQGQLIFSAPPTVFNDTSLRTFIDPADFTLAQTFSIIDAVQDGYAINGEIDSVTVERITGTVVPTPTAAGAGLVLLLGVLSRRRRGL